MVLLRKYLRYERLIAAFNFLLSKPSNDRVYLPYIISGLLKGFL